MSLLSRLLRASVVIWWVALGVTWSAAWEAPVRIMPLGDSLTYGETLTSVQGGYRNRLYSRLTAIGYNVDFVGTFADTNNPGLPDVDHQGLGGARIDQIQTNLTGWLDSVADPDVVLLLIGTNDVWQNYDLANAPTRLSNLIADIANQRPFAKIIVSNLPARIDSTTFEAKQVTYNAAIPGIVAQHVSLGRQVTWLDMHAVLTPLDYSSDGVHPSTAGYQKMADAWLPAIAAVIAPQGTANPPVIDRIDRAVDLNHLTVVFSKPVADSAVELTHFSLSGGLAVSDATLDAATKRNLTLTTGGQIPGTVYSLTVSGVCDRTAAQTPIAPQSMVLFYPNAITNGSFEDDYAGWTATGNQEIKSGTPYVASDGSHMVAFNTGQSTPNGTLAISFATVAGRTYQLGFDVGVLAYNTRSQQLKVTVQGAASLLTASTTVNGVGSGITVWVAKAYSFIADSATTRVTFSDQSNNTSNIDLLLDNVRVGSPVSDSVAISSLPTSGAAMTITPADSGGNGAGTTGLIRAYIAGTSVTVTAAAMHAGGAFLRWQQNGVDLPGSSTTLTFTMAGNRRLTAVYAVNAAPVAAADTYATSEDVSLVVTAPGVLGNDADPEAMPLAAMLETTTSHGSLTLGSNGGFSYLPQAEFHGSDSFSYRASDGINQSTVTTVAITVNPVNDPPVANAQTVNVAEDAAVAIILTGSDVDGDSLNYRVGSGPSNGTLTGAAPMLTYTPAPHFSGSDSFTVIANDGTADSAPAVVSIGVTPVDDDFAEWLATYNVIALADGDQDGDGIANAVEYVVGGDPVRTGDSELLPTAMQVVADPDGDGVTAGYLLFSYRLSARAKGDPLATVQAEWSTSPAGPWMKADGNVGAVTVDGIDEAGVGMDAVNVYIPTAARPTLFARLKVVIRDAP